MYSLYRFRWITKRYKDPSNFISRNMRFFFYFFSQFYLGQCRTVAFKFPFVRRKFSPEKFQTRQESQARASFSVASPDPIQPGSPERTRHWVSRTQVLSCHSQPQPAKLQGAGLPAFCVSYQLHQEIQFVKLCFLAQPSAEIATLSKTLVTRPKVRKYT